MISVPFQGKPFNITVILDSAANTTAKDAEVHQFIVIHTAKGIGIVNKAEIDVLLELSCFFNDPADIGNLISGSSAFSKTSLNIWNSRFTYC